MAAAFRREGREDEGAGNSPMVRGVAPGSLELLGAPGGALLGGHTGPERGEVLRTAHVRSLDTQHPIVSIMIRETHTLIRANAAIFIH